MHEPLLNGRGGGPPTALEHEHPIGQGRVAARRLAPTLVGKLQALGERGVGERIGGRVRHGPPHVRHAVVKQALSTPFTLSALFVKEPTSVSGVL